MHFTVRFLPFWNQVDQSGGPEACWLWQGPTWRDYGFYLRGRKLFGTTRSHRVAWMLANEDHPGDLYVLHRCDVKSCVNPAHLYVGTQADNVRDMYERNPDIRANLSAALKGRPQKKGRRAKITAAYQRPEVKERHAAAMRRPDVRAKISAANRCRQVNPEVKERVSAAQKRRFADPAQRAKQSAALRAYHAKCRKGHPE